MEINTVIAILAYDCSSISELVAELPGNYTQTVKSKEIFIWATFEVSNIFWPAG